ncbi:helix-turn-helix domain-containing protein [Pluralibacter gergoviae]
MDRSESEFSVRVDEIAHLNCGAESGLTLLWILEGTLQLNVEERVVPLAANDMHIIQSNQSWSLNGSPGNVALRLTLAAGWLQHLDSDFFNHAYVIPDESSGRGPQCDELRNLLSQLLAGSLINHTPRHRLEAHRWVSEIVLLLASRFQQPYSQPLRPAHPGWSRRISQVVDRINASYRQRISLAEIARAEFVSEAWLSRLFHKEVGMSFMQYLSRLRLEKASDALRHSRQPLAHIALANGFASTRAMSDLFQRYYAMTPREFRQQKNLPETPSRARSERSIIHPVAPNRLFTLLNAPEPPAWQPAPENADGARARHITLGTLPRRAAALHHTRVVVTLRELDDLLRSDVRRDLDALRGQIDIVGIDIAVPFLSSRLFANGWDDPQRVGYACWYNVHQIFTWIAERGWSVLLHTGQTTGAELLARFLARAAGHFSAATLCRWDLVFHWSTQASDDARCAAWRSQREIVKAFLPQAKFGIWHRFSPRPAADTGLLASVPLLQADFLACAADSNEQLDLGTLEPAGLSAAENYPVERLRAIKSALRQQGLSLPVWLLSWNTLTGNTRDTNGSFFRGALLMQNLLGISDLAAIAGFWLNSGVQGESRSGGTIDTSSLALYYQHGLPRPIYWVLWLWQRLRGEIVVHDKNLLLLRHAGGYQLLVYNTVVFNPWLSSEEAFLQHFRQQYIIRLTDLQGAWRIKSHLYDRRTGALFPLLNAFQAGSGPDEEVLNWVRHMARPALAVTDERLQAGWQAAGALESNALMLYELAPVISPGAVS